jgi:hypothetical protein
MMKRLNWLGVLFVVGIPLIALFSTGFGAQQGGSQSQGFRITRVFPRILTGGNTACIYLDKSTPNGFKIDSFFIGEKMVSASKSTTPCVDTETEQAYALRYPTDLPKDRNLRVIVRLITTNKAIANYLIIGSKGYIDPIARDDDPVKKRVSEANSGILVEYPTVSFLPSPNQQTNKLTGVTSSAYTPRKAILAVNVSKLPNSFDGRVRADLFGSILTNKSKNLNTRIARFENTSNNGYPYIKNSTGLCGRVFVMVSAVNSASDAEFIDEVHRYAQDVNAELGAETLGSPDPEPQWDPPSLSSVSATTTSQTQPNPGLDPDIRGIKVAVIDTGISPHQALNNVGNSYDFTDDTNADKKGFDYFFERRANPFGKFVVVGHGTGIASIVAGSGSYLGIAPDANVQAYKVCNNRDGICRGFPVLNGICQAVANQVDVINFSLSSRTDSNLIRLALLDAANQGISIVTSAGNRGYTNVVVNTVRKQVSQLGFPQVYTEDFLRVESGQFKLPPIPAIPGMIAVSAVTTSKHGNNAQDLLQPDPDSNFVPDFSSRGEWVTVAAPGAAVMAARVNQDLNKTDSYFPFSGTSYSAPFVTGVIARIKAGYRYDNSTGNVEDTPQAIKRYIQENAFGAARDKIRLNDSVGWGVVQLPIIKIPK